MAWARRAFREKAGGGLERTYDLTLAKAFEGLDPANPPPPVWDLFDKLAGIPLMLVHGGLSDLLSPRGVQDMIARRPDIDLVEVADQGHAPLLADRATMEHIVAFCAALRPDAGSLSRRGPLHTASDFVSRTNKEKPPAVSCRGFFRFRS